MATRISLQRRLWLRAFPYCRGLWLRSFPYNRGLWLRTFPYCRGLWLRTFPYNRGLWLRIFPYAGAYGYTHFLMSVVLFTQHVSHTYSIKKNGTQSVSSRFVCYWKWNKKSLREAKKRKPECVLCELCYGLTSNNDFPNGHQKGRTSRPPHWACYSPTFLFS